MSMYDWEKTYLDYILINGKYKKKK